MSAVSVVADRLVEETARAVAFGHSHVVVLTEAPFAADMPGRLAEHLRDAMPSFVLRFDAKGGGARLVEQVRSAIRGLPEPGSSLDLARPARQDRPRAAILVPEALDVPSEVLRDVYALTEARGAGARLVLLVDRDGCGARDPAALLAARLGAGIAKVENEARSAPTPQTGEEAPPGPPRIVHERTGRTRPLRVRAVSASHSGGPVAVAMLLAAALVTGWVAAPFLVRGVPLTRRAPVAAAPAPLRATTPSRARVAARREEPAPEATPIVVPTPPGARSIEPPAVAPSRATPPDPSMPPSRVAERPPAKPTPEVEPAAEPKPAARVFVDFNAVPWAELEVDGRAIGPTPVGRVPLAPGPHEVRARFPDGRVVERDIEVDALRNHFRFD